MSKTLWLVLGIGTCVVAGTQLNRCLSCAPEQQVQVDASLRSAGATFLAAKTPEPGPAAKPAPGPALPPVPNIADEGMDGEIAETEGDGAEGDGETDLVKLVPEAREAAEADAGGKLSLTFDKLASYDYKFPDVGAEEKDTKQIPPSVRKLDGREISIRGFMIPMTNDGEDVLEFVLVRNQFACCYGIMPKMNEWVHVKMAPGKTAPFALDIPITVHGTLEVGEVWENGVVMSLYRLECTQVDEPPIYR